MLRIGVNNVRVAVVCQPDRGRFLPAHVKAIKAREPGGDLKGINYEVFFGHWVDCARSQAGVAVHSCVELMGADTLGHIVDVLLFYMRNMQPTCLNDVSAQLPTRNFAPATFISSPVLAFGVHLPGDAKGNHALLDVFQRP